MSWPQTEPAWLEAWTLWRLRGRIEARPKAPATIPEVGWQFERFVIWRQRGGYADKRPGGLWYPTPPWVWLACDRILTALKPPPAPAPAPAPAPVDPLAAWHLPVLYVGESGAAAQWAQRAKQSGFQSVAAQLATATDADASAVHAAGLVLHAWGIAASTDVKRLAELGAAGYQPQIEGPGQRDSAVSELTKGTGGLPRGIVTTFSGLEDPAQAARVTPYITATFVECYYLDGPGVHNDLNRMMWQARQYGLPQPVPVVGLYDGIHVSDYPALPSCGRNFGVWRAEQMAEQDWADVAKLTGAA